MKKSIIGQYRKLDGRDLSDRAYGRGPAQDFILRTKEDNSKVRTSNNVLVSSTPKMSKEVLRCLEQAVNMTEGMQLPAIVEVMGYRVQIYNII